jgi:hypothetical protein
MDTRTASAGPERPLAPPTREQLIRAAAAAHAVMLAEVAWFQTLDRVTLWRIAYSAPPTAPEYRYAVDELARRADFTGEGGEVGESSWSERV